MNSDTHKVGVANDYFPDPTINNGKISSTKDLVKKVANYNNYTLIREISIALKYAIILE